MIKTPSARLLTRRDALKSISTAGAALAISGCTALRPGSKTTPRTSDPEIISRENQHPGTVDWMLERTRIDPATKYRCPWIEGFCSRTSVAKGQALKFHVSTNPVSRFSIDIYRLGYYGGTGGRHLLRLGPFQGRIQPDPPIGEKRVRDCRWKTSATVRIPPDWVSGVYLGKLTAERDRVQSYVVFIVRDHRRADYLFQCSDTTWAAYNRWPDHFALYDDGKKEWYWGPNVQVSFNRPYGKYCQILDAPLSTGSGEFLLWEFPLAYWMEKEGFNVSYISNLDTHGDAAGLFRAKGLLSVGHDEYWSQEMFENVRRAIAGGVNVAFLSGNSCYGRIQFGPDRARRRNRAFERIDIFAPRHEEELRDFPEMRGFPFVSSHGNSLMGAHSTPPVTGGADWICVKPEHWLFRGTGMKAGEGIPGLVGWEFHGDPAPIPGLEIVAAGPTRSGRGIGTFTSTIYPGGRGNFVFNASSCWWADSLSEPPGYVRPFAYTSPCGPDRRAQQITRNLLERMRTALP